MKLKKRTKELEEAWVKTVEILKSVGLNQWDDIKKELGEAIVADVYSGTQLNGSQKGVDVIAKDGRRIQAKFRTTSGYGRDGEPKRKTPIKASNFNCEVFAEVVTNPDTAEIMFIVEYSKEAVEKAAAHDGYDNINVVSAGKLKEYGEKVYER